MYLDLLVKIPDVKGKITRKAKGNAVYINYEYGRKYDPDRKYNIPQRATIGKASKADSTMMQPNQNFLMYFPGTELPDEKFQSKRCSLIRIGAQLVIDKIIDEYKLRDVLGNYFDTDLGLLLDMASYSIIAENNAGQYYPDYAYNHPLFTDEMKMYSDSKVSDFLHSITADQSVGFLNEWNASRNHKEKIYISYDSTNKNSQAGALEMAEFGHAKADIGAPIINYSVAYDVNNRTPLYYEEYPGSVNDVSQLQYMIKKAQGYGYRKIGFILDRGYFSKDNIEYMDACGYSFVIMVKGMASFVSQMVLENRGSFEDKRKNCIWSHDVYGMTVKKKLYVTDEKDRYFHIYHNSFKEASEKAEIEEKLQRLKKGLSKQIGEKYEPSETVKEYFDLIYGKDDVLVAFREKEEVIERELQLCGYFVIVTSEQMTAADAIDLYKSRDTSEKLFSGDKSFLGNKSYRTHTNESTSGKIFVEFIALIIRCRIYTCLKDEAERLDNKPNYMTVPAAIKELEKIEMLRGYDNVYRLDHAVTATQKTILGAFNISENDVKRKAERISERLRMAKE
jgi:transposase